MSERDRAPQGAPCWTDLWTSEVAGSRRFYSDLLGWEAGEPSPEFGGYFMFTRQGVPVAGATGPMGDRPATNRWRVALASPGLEATLEAAQGQGAELQAPAMEVADLGRQALLADPSGAPLALWEPRGFAGFTVLDEPGTPGWFELVTADREGAVSFYSSVFGWVADAEEESHHRHATLMRLGREGAPVASIVDSGLDQSQGLAEHWSTYWLTLDPDRDVARALELGGSLLGRPQDSPFGRLATLLDPAGAQFKLRALPG